MNNINNNKNKIIIIAGPTCVGKTNISIKLAKILDSEIISIDSMQVYKNMNIGTAKITKDEMQNINHYMIDEIDIDDNYDIKRFKDKTNEYIDIILKKDKIPILVGGTGFYINAILYDTDFIEEDDTKKQNIIDSLNKELNDFGIDYLYEELKKVDLESSKIIHKNNTKRIIRALTFYYLHNKKISMHNEFENKKEKKYNGYFIYLNDNRDNLYKNIDNRVDKMIKNGLVNEIINLIKYHNAKKNTNAMNAIGYKELYDYCEKLIYNNKNNLEINELYKDECFIDIINKIKQHSRNFAKRQLTWFKNKSDFLEIRIDKYDYDDEKILKKIVTDLKKM